MTTSTKFLISAFLFFTFSFLPVESMTSTWSHQHHRVKTANQPLRLSSAMAQRTTSSHRPWTMRLPRGSNKMYECTGRRGSARTLDTGKGIARELAISSRLKSIYNNPQNIHTRRVIARSNDDHSANAAGSGGSSHGNRQPHVVVIGDANNAAANEGDRSCNAARRLKSRAEVSDSREMNFPTRCASLISSERVFRH